MQGRLGSPPLLSLFGVLLSHNFALQVLKDIRQYAMWPVPSFHLLITAPLAASIVGVHASRASPRWLVRLSMSAIVVLCAHGSQSNHVLLELAVTISLIATAPMSTLLAALHWHHDAKGKGDDGTTSMRHWEERLVFALRAILCILYAVTGFAKLNVDWFNPVQSCCVQMATAVLGDLMPRSEWILRALPLSAVVFELGFPVIMIGALAVEHLAFQRADPSLERTARVILRACTAAGSAFHVVIAFPPPPMSVYPFSMLMAPIYVAVLPVETAESILGALGATRRTHATSAAVLAVAVLGAHVYSLHTDRFEYPPYFSWELGALWVLLVFAALAAIAIFAPLQPGARRSGAAVVPPVPQMGFLRGALAFAPAAAIAAIGSAPYLGVRTHPSFAMFSNLRVEGNGTSNHWLVHRVGDHTVFGVPLVPPEYRPSSAIEIVATDLAAVRDLQVNLAPLLPAGTLAALRRVGSLAEFYIAPPKWGLAPTEATFRPFAVPLVEVRRRLAAAAQEGTDFYVRYRDLRHAGTSKPAVREYRRRGGVRTRGSDASLDEPLPTWRAMLHRFRTFDDRYSPCRH